jgi:hypothetical protein
MDELTTQVRPFLRSGQGTQRFRYDILSSVVTKAGERLPRRAEHHIPSMQPVDRTRKEGECRCFVSCFGSGCAGSRRLFPHSLRQQRALGGGAIGATADVSVSALSGCGPLVARLMAVPAAPS